ncbi:MAG: hypothetical protein IID41_13130 [Planctomycetes bacterium]|nr:hypothetical protein [Planctomycetota bacterium]
MNIKAHARTLTLWTGSILSLLIAAAFVVSAWCWIVIQVPTNRGPALYLIAGSASLVADEMLSIPVLIERSRIGLSRWNAWDGESGVYVQLPIYAVFAAIALPTLLVWRFVPKFPRDHCRRCGYNLTGLTEARCPECEAVFEPR